VVLRTVTAVDAIRDRPRAVVLVEGDSDARALRTLAARRGRDLDAERVRLVAIGGATNIRHALQVFGPGGLDVQLAGLCDAAEERFYRRGLERAGLGADLDADKMAELGFRVCVVDLEDELIRALGPDAVEDVIATQGELPALRTFARQPAQRERDRSRQLRRFLGTRAGRKLRYAQALVEALDLSRVPTPLDGVLTAVRATTPPTGPDREGERGEQPGLNGAERGSRW
jgi:hypothetical protein